MDKLMYCPFCDLETMCNVLGSGNKFACTECCKEFYDEIISVSEIKDEVYKNYIIKPKRDFGDYGFLIDGKRVREGFVVVDKHNINVMPGATWFQTIDDAKKGIDVLIKYGEKNFWKGYKLETSLNENKK